MPFYIGRLLTYVKGIYPEQPMVVGESESRQGVW
jgi:hypothetical protein